MCGILATINHDFSLSKEALYHMRHRGPDATGEYTYKNVGLGHLRLSIQDLSVAANQPMHDNNENYCIVFNGEIYNHWEIRTEELSDYSFKTSSDTETIIALYIKYGEKSVHYLNGIFAFAILDRNKDEIFVARDHFGVKPLYYNLTDTHFSCASELKGLLPFTHDFQLDIRSIQSYMTYMWCPGEGTPLKSISKLLPGTFMKIDINNVSNKKIVNYYKLKYPKKVENNKPNDLWIDELEQKLIQAVNRQLLSDAPIGFFLSGGLDSSLLVAIARKLLPNKELKCYTIDSGESKDGFTNDLYYARKVAKYLDVELVEIKVKSDIVSIFDDIIWYLDEPQSDPAPFNAYQITKAARKDGIKVLIGGTGGDDIFSGYRRHQALLADKYFDYFPVYIRQVVKDFVQDLKSKKPIVRRLKKLTKSIQKPKDKRYIGYFEWQDFEFIKSIFKEELHKELQHENDYFKILMEEINDLESDLNKLLYLEIYTFLIGHNLNYTDKAGMANSVEIRVPYLDVELVEFSTLIPANLKMKGKETKFILKKVAEKYLPQDVIYRPKSGFGAPVEYWVRNELDQYINKNLSKKKITDSNIFKFERINEIVDLNKSGKINASYSVWSFLAIQSWMKQFLNNQGQINAK